MHHLYRHKWADFKTSLAIILCLSMAEYPAGFRSSAGFRLPLASHAVTFMHAPTLITNTNAPYPEFWRRPSRSAGCVCWSSYSYWILTPCLTWAGSDNALFGNMQFNLNLNIASLWFALMLVSGIDFLRVHLRDAGRGFVDILYLVVLEEYSGGNNSGVGVDVIVVAVIYICTCGVTVCLMEYNARNTWSS